MSDCLKELERWERLRTKGYDRGLHFRVDRHRISMTTSSLRITDMGRSAVTFGSLEDAESWLDGYDYMAQHAQNLGFDVKAAERAALDAWDQKRIETVLSRD